MLAVTHRNSKTLLHLLPDYTDPRLPSGYLSIDAALKINNPAFTLLLLLTSRMARFSRWDDVISKADKYTRYGNSL